MSTSVRLLFCHDSASFEGFCGGDERWWKGVLLAWCV